MTYIYLYIFIITILLMLWLMPNKKIKAISNLIVDVLKAAAPLVVAIFVALAKCWGQKGNCNPKAKKGKEIST